LSRDCRRIVASERYQRLFRTRLSARHQAVPEFETTPQGCRIATSVGGVLTGQGVDIIIIDDPLKLEEALSQPQRSPPTIAVEFHNIAVLGIAMDKGSAQVCSHGNIASRPIRITRRRAPEENESDCHSQRYSDGRRPWSGTGPMRGRRSRAFWRCRRRIFGLGLL
jgi:hypothetical protein